jgi:hypothetical protein
VNELPIPPVAQTDPAARELVRVWAASGSLHVTLATGLWSDPAAWGLMLVDLAKHVANSYEKASGQPAAEVLARVRQGFDAEWERPTDSPTGNLLK